MHGEENRGGTLAWRDESRKQSHAEGQREQTEAGKSLGKGSRKV